VLGIIVPKLQQRLADAADDVQNDVAGPDPAAAALMRLAAPSKVAAATASIKTALVRGANGFMSHWHQLQSGLDRLVTRERFNGLRADPVPPHVEPWRWLGMEEGASAAAKMAVASQWAQYRVAHAAGEKPVPLIVGVGAAPTPAPRNEQVEWWKQRLARWSVLSPHAQRQLAMPVGNGALESKLSFSEDMYKKNRVGLGAST